MSQAIVTISDFAIGTVILQKDNQTEDQLDAIVDEYQDDYIYKLLGAELGALFLADLNGSGVPASARFLSIYNAFASDSGCDGVVQSKGIKFFIKNIIWFHYARQNNVSISTSGNNVKLGENSEPNNSGRYLAHVYNQAIDTGKAIQWYINQNSGTYPEYKWSYLDYCIGV